MKIKTLGDMKVSALCPKVQPLVPYAGGPNRYFFTGGCRSRPESRAIGRLNC